MLRSEKDTEPSDGAVQLIFDEGQRNGRILNCSG